MEVQNKIEKSCVYSFQKICIWLCIFIEKEIIDNTLASSIKDSTLAILIFFISIHLSNLWKDI